MSCCCSNVGAEGVCGWSVSTYTAAAIPSHGFRLNERLASFWTESKQAQSLHHTHHHHQNELYLLLLDYFYLLYPDVLWLEPEHLSISHQSSGLYTGVQLHLEVLLLVYKSLNGLGPKYTADILTEYKPNRPLKSVETPRVHAKQESAFSYYEPASRRDQMCWNIKSRLITHLFRWAFTEWALCYVQTDCTIIIFYS